MDVFACLPGTLEELHELERIAEREWWWLNGALHAVAQMQVERPAGVLTTFRQMQEQAREIDRRRVEIAVRIAEVQAAVEAPARRGNRGTMARERASSEGVADDRHRP